MYCSKRNDVHVTAKVMVYMLQQTYPWMYFNERNHVYVTANVIMDVLQQT